MGHARAATVANASRVLLGLVLRRLVASDLLGLVDQNVCSLIAHIAIANKLLDQVNRTCAPPLNLMYLCHIRRESINSQPLKPVSLWNGRIDDDARYRQTLM
jgi:hypothetical protein